jgi:hypothetical protein
MYIYNRTTANEMGEKMKREKISGVLLLAYTKMKIEKDGKTLFHTLFYKCFPEEKTLSIIFFFLVFLFLFIYIDDT